VQKCGTWDTETVRIGGHDSAEVQVWSDIILNYRAELGGCPTTPDRWDASPEGVPRYKTDTGCLHR